jgi:hypothetical protein
MTALEAHIQVLQGVQKIAGFSQDMFHPEEIDLQLSRHQSRIVDEIVNKVFQDVQVAADYIRPLVVKDYQLPLEKVLLEDNAVRGTFPGNYLNLINSRSRVVRSSNALHCNNLVSFKTPITATEYLSIVGLPVSTATTAPYYYRAKVILTTASGDQVVLQAPDSLYLKSTKSVFYAVNYILDYFKYSGVQVYWETYKTSTVLNSLIFVTKDSTITKARIEFSKPDTTVEASSEAVFSPVTIFVYNSNFSTAIPGYYASIAPNTVIELDQYYEQSKNILYKPKPENPKAVISGSQLTTYESKNFIISELYIDYVRKPKNVSLALSQGLELGGNGPQIVIDRVIEYLKMTIENPSYQANIADNLKRNQI